LADEEEARGALAVWDFEDFVDFDLRDLAEQASQAQSDDARDRVRQGQAAEFLR